jgi:methionyl aminopeptidase
MEIEQFKEAGRIAAIILKSLLNKAEEGKTTNELDQLARKECDKFNVKPAFLGYRKFPAAICSSVNNVMVHGIPNDIPLKKGDILSLDVGVDLNGYIGDNADTLIIGEPDNKLAIECRLSLQEAIKKCVAGNKLSEIGKTVHEIAKKNNFQIPLNYGGHGISRFQLHTPPFIPNYFLPYDDVTLYPNMLFAIEPMFIDSIDNQLKVASDKWAVIANGNTSHCEHTILITEDEPLILTRRE